ncbi:hypothetical protein EST38_g5337 [Candolleomyces aberdarensis]|uniref:F-box domain-containing protein n=1 Tax=Candolleomyces aberdarensis TaxID=2316362 RepID=A0A4Q2DMG4_9AGAR|nr:hypothetical protein EST38_g5337 [Candolleomyces aberdarensis]
MSTSTSSTRRTSSRLQRKGVKSQQQPAESDSDTTGSTVAPKPPRKKQKASKPNVDATKDNASATVSAAETAKQKAAWAKVRGRRGQLKLVVEMPFDILLEIFQYLQPADLLCLTKANGTFYLKSEYERHMKALSRKADTSRYGYVAEEKKKLSPRYDRLYEFRTWESQQSRLKRDDIETRRGNRSDAIKEKLKELGYDDVLPSLISWGGSLCVPHAKGVKPLTEREWERIKPEVTGVLDKRRMENRVNQRRSLLQERTSLLMMVYKYYISHNRSVAIIPPSHSEVAKTEPFRTLIYDTPSDKKLTEADFLAHIDELPQIFKSWLERTTNFLLGLIPQEPETSKSAGKAKKTTAKAKGKGKGKEKETAPVDAAILDLATTLFGCNSCKAILPYHQALCHGCFSRKSTPKNPTLDESADPNGVWNGTGLAKYHQVASDCASEIITILGKNPETVTGEELDEARQRLECVRCLGRTPAGRPKRLIMDWRNAVVHEVLRHTSEEAQAEQKHSGSTKEWEIVEGKRLTATYKREVTLEAPGKESWRSVFCVECGLWELDDKNGEIKRANQWGWTERAIPPGESTCASNHDMSMGTYQAGHPSFRLIPYTVIL